MLRRHFVLGLLALPHLSRVAHASTPAYLRLAPASEPGRRLRISGTVFAADGTTPVPGVRLFVYQTDAEGYYTRPQSSPRNARLRGSVTTDTRGTYLIDTIHPGSYPDSTIAPHIHVHVYAPGLPPHWIEDFHFAGDPYLRPHERSPQRFGGTVALTNNAGRRDIRLDAKLADSNRLVDGWYRQ